MHLLESMQSKWISWKMNAYSVLLHYRPLASSIVLCESNTKQKFWKQRAKCMVSHWLTVNDGKYMCEFVYDRRTDENACTVKTTENNSNGDSNSNSTTDTNWESAFKLKPVFRTNLFRSLSWNALNSISTLKKSICARSAVCWDYNACQN